MIVGYARTSTSDQTAGLESQFAELGRTSVERIFQEQVSAIGERKALEEALDFCREGDTFVVTKLDRLARSIIHLAQIVDRLQRKKVSLRILNLNLDTSTPTGKLMINLLASIAAFEREIMLERQRDGIVAAKKQGKYKGRTPTARRRAPQVLQLLAEGHSISDVARSKSFAKVVRSSVSRMRTSRLSGRASSGSGRSKV
jgi:DNA invertase Pin-like site-specific DNA recombinase